MERGGVDAGLEHVLAVGEVEHEVVAAVLVGLEGEDLAWRG